MEIACAAFFWYQSRPRLGIDVEFKPCEQPHLLGHSGHCVSRHLCYEPLLVRSAQPQSLFTCFFCCRASFVMHMQLSCRA